MAKLPLTQKMIEIVKAVEHSQAIKADSTGTVCQSLGLTGKALVQLAKYELDHQETAAFNLEINRQLRPVITWEAAHPPGVKSEAGYPDGISPETKGTLPKGVSTCPE